MATRLVSDPKGGPRLIRVEWEPTLEELEAAIAANDAAIAANIKRREVVSSRDILNSMTDDEIDAIEQDNSKAARVAKARLYGMGGVALAKSDERVQALALALDSRGLLPQATKDLLGIT